MDGFDPWRYKCFRVFLPHGTSEQLIAVLVLVFFFMNVSNKLGYIHGNGLKGYQIAEEQCKRCLGPRMCKRCPGTYQLSSSFIGVTSQYC